MEISNIAFDFSPLGRNSKNKRRTAITGMTMTVYDSRFNLAADVLDAIGNPEKISISYNDQLEAFAVYADPDGMPVNRQSAGGKTYSRLAVKEVLENKGCDFGASFYRLLYGKKYGRFVLFSITDIVEIKREARNGNI